MEHLLKPMLQIAEVYLKFFPNLEQLKTFAKVSTTRCSPYSVGRLKIKISSSTCTHNSSINGDQGEDHNNTKWTNDHVVRNSSKNKRPIARKNNTCLGSIVDKGKAVDGFVES
jgi:hypothetical protein